MGDSLSSFILSCLRAKEFASVAVGLFIEHERRIKSLLCHCLVSRPLPRNIATHRPHRSGHTGV